jgi:hypothetical protein
MDRVEKLFHCWLDKGIYYGLGLGAMIGPFIEIYAISRQYQSRELYLNIDSPFLAAGAILTGAPYGAFLGATFPFWAPYFIFAKFYRFICSPIYIRPPSYEDGRK